MHPTGLHPTLINVSFSSSSKFTKAPPVTDTEVNPPVVSAEWPEENRSCMRRKSPVAGDEARAKQEWLEDQAYCILNSVTIAGVG